MTGKKMEGAHDPNPLGPRDSRILDAFMATGSIPAAAKIVGVDRSTAWRRANQPLFQEEFRRRSDELRRGADVALLARQDAAWTAIDQSLASTDERIRLRAATWLLERVMAGSERRGQVPTVVDRELEEVERALLLRLQAGEGEAS
jgi:molybdenum-dependent DNA-binding transcriptional regulator ModE